MARDLCSVSNELAVSLLRQFDSLVHAEVAKASRALPCLTGVDREDFVAEGRVAVLDAHLTYRAERGGPKAAWVRVVVRNRLRDVIRRSQARFPRTDIPTTDIAADALWAEMNAVVDRVTLEDLVGRLSLRRRTIVACRFWHDETLKEIGATIGISASRTHQELAAALAKLQQMLGQPALDEEYVDT